MSSKKPKVARLELKPTQVNTGFAQGNFDPRTGIAGYELNPELAAMRDIFYGGANDYLGNNLENSSMFGQGVSGYGQDRFTQAAQYDIPQIAKDWYRGNQALMADDRAQEESRLADTLFKTGATGNAVGMQGGYVNPQQFALLKAREQANAGLSLQSEDRARNIQTNDMNLGLSLFGQGQNLQTSPYAAASGIFGLGTGIEGLGMDTLNATSNFAQQQMGIQQALQQNQQAINNSKAKGGFGGALGGLLSSPIGQAGMNWATGGISGGLQGMMSGNPFSAVSSAISSWSPFASAGNIGGVGDMMSSYGSGYSSLLGGNTIAPNYSIGPTWR